MCYFGFEPFNVQWTSMLGGVQYPIFATGNGLCCLRDEVVSPSTGRVVITILHLCVGFSVYLRVRVFLS